MPDVRLAAPLATKWFSDVVNGVGEAMSIRFNNVVYDLKRQGTHVTVLSLGEAFFDIPLMPMDVLPYPHIYHYTHSRGLYELRVRVARFYEETYGVTVDAEREIIITAGSKAAIHFTLMSLLNPGDEVLIHEPTWVSYPEQVKLCYAKPVLMPYDRGIADYEKFITDHTKVIIVNNPNNPRGFAMSASDLRYLTALAKANGLYVLADEAYSDFVRESAFHSFGAFDPDKANVIVCNSFSKNFGISGWRLGYAISNPELINRVLKVNQHLITCPASILQYYMARYFDEIMRITKPQIEAVVEKRRVVAEFLDDIGLRYLPGDATFYFFVSIAPTKLGSEEFAMRLLLEEHVCVVPGIGYGDSCDSFVRVSVGTESIEYVRRGLLKMKELIEATS